MQQQLLLRKLSKHSALAGLTLMFYFLSSAVFAQIEEENLRIDSIRTFLKTTANDSLRFYSYTALAREYLDDSGQDSAIRYSKEAFVVASKVGNKKWQAEALYILGKAELVSAGPRDRAVKHLLKSLEINTTLEDKEGIAACNLQLGVLSYDMQNYPNAVSYLLKTIENTTKKSLIAISHYLLALSYSELNKFTEAEKMFDLSSKEFGTDRPIYSIQIKTFRGKMYTNMGRYELAIDTLQELVEEIKVLPEAYSLAPAYAFLSTAYLKTEDFKNTIKYAGKAYRITKDLPAFTIYHREATDNLHCAFERIDNIDSAYYFLSELRALNDSISSNNVLQSVAELKGKFDLEQEIAKQKAEQTLKDAIVKKELEREKLLRNLFFIGFIVVVLFAALFLNQRNKVSKEKKRSDELLLNILPAITAEELKSTGTAAAKMFNNVTVIFTDFKGFTELSEKLTPTQIVSEIHSYFSAFDAIIDKYGIEKIKTIGDSYMAASGLPLPTPQSTKNAVFAAMEMLDYLQKHKPAEGIPKLEMRCGLHTGPIVAGIVGIKKFQYDIWGDTVNTASRMENNGQEGKLNISQFTYEILKDDPDFTFEYRGKLNVKGKGPMAMWFVALNAD